MFTSPLTGWYLSGFGGGGRMVYFGVFQDGRLFVHILLASNHFDRSVPLVSGDLLRLKSVL